MLTLFYIAFGALMVLWVIQLSREARDRAASRKPPPPQFDVWKAHPTSPPAWAKRNHGIIREWRS